MATKSQVPVGVFGRYLGSLTRYKTRDENFRSLKKPPPFCSFPLHLNVSYANLLPACKRVNEVFQVSGLQRLHEFVFLAPKFSLFDVLFSFIWFLSCIHNILHEPLCIRMSSMGLTSVFLIHLYHVCKEQKMDSS